MSFFAFFCVFLRFAYCLCAAYALLIHSYFIGFLLFCISIISKCILFILYIILYNFSKINKYIKKRPFCLCAY